MDRITAIRRSLAAFVFGIFALVPLVGVLPAICALGHWWAVQSKFRTEWNPASGYLRAGGAFALWGILSSALLVLVLAISISNGGL